MGFLHKSQDRQTNIHRIFNEIMVQKVLSNKDIQVQYLSQWIRVLKEHDKVLINQFNNRQAIAEFIVKIQSEPEIFQLPIHWKDDIVYLHFRVSIANEISKEYYSQSEVIPIEEFKGETQCIYWTKVEENVESYAGNNQPIIAVPYFSGKNNLLIIDGNHRLTYAVKHNDSGVRTLIISEKSTIEQQIFQVLSINCFIFLIMNLHVLGVKLQRDTETILE